MKSFNLFDTVKTIEAIPLADGNILPINTIGVIVEIYNPHSVHKRRTKKIRKVIMTKGNTDK